jgi:predicted nuclease of predicted toxin-antitoxin system
MKLLLDENLPRKLKLDLYMHDVFTVRDMGWEGTGNGDLLQLMIQNGFQVLITFDKNLQHQQNFEKHPVAVVLLVAESNQYKNLKPLVSSVLANLETISAGVTIIEG